MDTKNSKNLKNDFYNWCKRNNKQPKSQEEVQDLLVTFITENKKKYPEEYAKIQEAQKQKTTKALHGAKLNYFKSLKHQCAEGEELYYYKEGGAVGCGCKKKDGDEVVTAKSGSAVEKFKQIKKGKFGVTALADATGSQGGFKKAEKKKLEYNKPRNNKPVTNVATQDKNPGSTKQPMQEAEERARHKNNYNNLKKGGEVKKECGGSKVIANFKAKCGTKMKKHKQGGNIRKMQTAAGGPLYLSADDIKGGLNLIGKGIQRGWNYLNTQSPQTYATMTLEDGRVITVPTGIQTGAPDFLPGRAAGNIGKVVGQIRKIAPGVRGAVGTTKSGKVVNVLEKKRRMARTADGLKEADMPYWEKYAGRIDYSE